MCRPNPWRDSSVVSESGRNAMSSVTTCTTVWGEANPCSSNVGENTATWASPGVRCRARRKCASAAPNRSGTARATRSSAATRS